MLSREDVLRIAKLSKLNFTEEEIEKYREELNKILDYIEQLNNVNTENVEPLFNVLDIKDKLRKDEIIDYKVRKELLENAPEKDEDFIIVPKVIGNENVDN